MDKRAKIALLGLGAAGAAGLAYYAYRRSCSGPEEVELEIEQAHIEWLTERAGAHTGGDVAAAFGKLLAHCMLVSGGGDDGAEKIFKEIRCNTCGGKKNKTGYTAILSPAERAFVDGMVAKYSIKGGADKCVRVMFEYAINDAEEASVFA